MALLHILHYPDPRLRNRAAPVEAVDDALRRFADDMLETMYDAPGIGLAAPQVGVSRRLIVMDISESAQEPMCLINPVILERSESRKMDEGCLSVPGVVEPVVRAASIRFRALDRDGQVLEREADGLLAACVQHEIDHLDGLLFIDHLTELKRHRVRKRLEKQRMRTM